MRFATLMVTQVVTKGQPSDHVYSETRKFLYQKMKPALKPNAFLTASYSCSSLSLIQQPEKLSQNLSDTSNTSKSLVALRESGNKKFGSESNISNSVLKAKRQISF